MSAKFALCAGLLSFGLLGAAQGQVAKTAKAKAPVAAVVTAPTPASTPAPKPPLAGVAPIPEAVRADLPKIFKNLVQPRFTVLADDELDPETRALAEAAAAEHLLRVRALMDLWLSEEWAQPQPYQVLTRLVARLANEFAIWGRDSTGAAQDEALAQALQVSGLCRPAGGHASEWVMRLSRLRVLPPETRRAAVQAERALLARWGTPREVSDAQALPAEQMLVALRATGRKPTPPLPPVLAYWFLGDDAATQLDPLLTEPALRCALHQWAGASPAQFRAATAMPASDFIWMPRAAAAGPAADDNPYPALGQHFGVQGRVTVEAELDSAGRLLRVNVTQRHFSVPGLRGARAFAFEAAMEAATLAMARGMTWPLDPAAQGARTVSREFNWSLK